LRGVDGALARQLVGDDRRARRVALLFDEGKRDPSFPSVVKVQGGHGAGPRASAKAAAEEMIEA
jgi:hypothetical protein